MTALRSTRSGAGRLGLPPWAGSEGRRLKLLFAGVGVVEATFLPFLPLFLNDAGFGPGAIGGILAATALAAFACNPLWGFAADHWLGSERALAAALLGTVPLALLLYQESATAALVVIAIALYGWNAPVMTLADVIGLQRLGPSRRGNYGAVRLWLSVGWALSAAVVGAVLESTGVRFSALVFAAAVAIAGTAVVLATRGGLGLRAVPADPAGSTRLRGRNIVIFLASVLAVNVGWRAASAFLALRIAGLGGGALLVGVSAAVQAAAEVPVMRWTSRVVRVGAARLFAFGCAAYVAVFVSWALTQSAAAAAAVSVLGGVGFALTNVGTVLVMDILAPARLRATAQSWARAMSMGLAPVIGVGAGGLVYGYLGPAALFAAAAGVTAIGAAVSFCVRMPQSAASSAVGLA